MSTQVYTSTPKHEDEAETTVLREKKWQNIMERAEKFDNQRKQRFYPRKPFESKENRRRGNFKRGPKKYNDPGTALAEKRRKQAIESMQIAEQRRIRKMKEKDDMDKLAEELEMLDISSNNEYLPDGRLKLTKKQLHAREMKQSRIRQFYEDQLNRKKKTVSFRSPVDTNTQACHPKRKVFPNKPRKPALKKEEVKNVDENDVKMASKPFIRYSKIQLREMCPFGVYFFP